MALRSAYRTTLTATNLNLNGTVSISLLAGDSLLEPEDVIDSESNSKIVTPVALNYLLTNPPSIGDINPSTAIFTSLTAQTTSGDFIATDSEIIGFQRVPKVVSARGLATAYGSPATIGSGAPNKGSFTTLTASSITGTAISSLSNVIGTNVNDKLVTPFTFLNTLNSPGPIVATNGAFTTLTVDVLSMGATLDVASGGTGFTSLEKGTMLLGTATLTLRKSPIATDNNMLLSADPTTLSGVQWSAVGSGSLSSGTTIITPASNDDATNYTISTLALVPKNLPSIFANPPDIGTNFPGDATFTNVDVAVTLKAFLSPSQGGIGITSYSKGDLVYGTANAYGRFPVGADGTILRADSTTIAGLKWITPPKASEAGVTEVITALPRGYLDYSSPVKTDAGFQFAYIRAKSADNTKDLYLVNAVAGLSSIPQSAALAGTVTISGLNVTGVSTSFTTDFLPGDVLFTTAGAVIESITSNTSLKLLTPLTGSNLSYKRGGAAPRGCYFLFVAGTSLYLSTRTENLGDTIVDIPASARQLPLFVSLDSSGFLLDIADLSNFLHDRYVKVENPVYVNGDYQITSSACRSDDDTTDIVILSPKTVSTSVTGINGLEAVNALTGTVNVNSLNVTGTSTAFTSEIKIGDYVCTNTSQTGARVVSIASNTALTVDRLMDASYASLTTYTSTNGTRFITSPVKFGTTALYLVGTSEYVTVDNLPDLGSTWTVEFFVYITSFATNQYILVNGDQAAFYFDTSGRCVLNFVLENGSQAGGTSSTTFAGNTWQHMAITYDGTTYKVYGNGTQAITFPSTLKWNTSYYMNSKLKIWSAGTPVNWQIDEFRISNNVRYTGAFTAPTAAFTQDPNTVALQHFEMTPTSDYNAYSINNGATLTTDAFKFGSKSICFPNTTSVATLNISSFSVFTIECFVYIPTIKGNNTIIGSGYTNNANTIYFDSIGRACYRLTTNGGLITGSSTGTFATNTWHHVALSFDGSTYRLFVNGNQVASTSGSALNTTYYINGQFYIGLDATDYGNRLNGYIDEFRLSNNARYTTTFTPPTSMFTYDANTLALFHFDTSGAQLTDSALMSVSSATLLRKMNPGNATMYLYSIAHKHRPGYLLSTRSVKHGSSPVLPAGYGPSRQLPYIFPTKADGSLYALTWSSTLATFLEDPFSIPKSVAPYANSYIYLVIGDLLGKASKVVNIKVDNNSLGNVSSFSFRSDAIYSYTQAMISNSSTASVSENYTLQLDNNNSILVNVSGTPVVTYTLQGFYVTELV